MASAPMAMDSVRRTTYRWKPTNKAVSTIDSTVTTTPPVTSLTAAPVWKRDAACTITRTPEPAMNAALARITDDGAWGTWVHRWTAEEGRHSICMRDYLLVTRAVDPVELERGRMRQMEKGYDSTGYAEYSTVLDRQRRQLAGAVNALAEAMSKISVQVS